ncbi:MAG: Mov34/MPN/PAD-1 family protein [Candidatus Thermoplasmatota archaeon]|nr:Mov34/MPN/PAD-1 family protein [Candidatus Thermoplasmatota archaeon]MBU1940532.1 Mov34/MPN/PAD-1 family protein [Candidatus Thermoplasmatota archaeon]
MGFFYKKQKKVVIPPVWEITPACLSLIFECAKSSYPNEFGGFLRVDVANKYRIIELELLPGTISGDSSAIFHLHMLPIDFSVVGTVHSHPRGPPLPSGADLDLFDKFGRVHIISAAPYSESTWKAYDFRGNEIHISVLE